MGVLFTRNPVFKKKKIKSFKSSTGKPVEIGVLQALLSEKANFPKANPIVLLTSVIKPEAHSHSLERKRPVLHSLG